jgi:Cof subfamily protein (haloacid dehalogenase superfamily)
MIKCIAIDMDGTLVNSEQVVSKENAQAIKTAQKAGVEVVIATGRSYEEARYVLEEAGLHTYLICANGAELRNPQGEKQYSVGMTMESIREVENIFKKFQLYFEVYTSEGTYSNDYEKALAVLMDIYLSASLKDNYEKSLEAAKERFNSGRVKLIEEYEALFQDPNKDIYKLLAFSFDEEKLEQAKIELVKLDSIAVSASGKENIEINDENAQKGIAVTSFVQERHISLEETMAIGDNYNDVSMFQRVGRAVAMGNAPQEIKEFAHIVTGTNDEHGVAQAILNALETVKQ